MESLESLDAKIALVDFVDGVSLILGECVFKDLFSHWCKGLVCLYFFVKEIQVKCNVYSRFGLDNSIAGLEHITLFWKMRQQHSNNILSVNYIHNERERSARESPIWICLQLKQITFFALDPLAVLYSQVAVERGWRVVEIDLEVLVPVEQKQ